MCYLFELIQWKFWELSWINFIQKQNLYEYVEEIAFLWDFEFCFVEYDTKDIFIRSELGQNDK